MIETIANANRVEWVMYTPTCSVKCPVNASHYDADLIVIYRPDELLLEVESFDAWCAERADRSLIVEDFCRLVFGILRERLGQIPLHVTVRARTTAHAPLWASIETEDFREYPIPQTYLEYCVPGGHVRHAATGRGRDGGQADQV